MKILSVILMGLFFTSLSFGAIDSIRTFQKCVAATGTPEALSATKLLAQSVAVQSNPANTAVLFIGSSAGQTVEVPVGASVSLEAAPTRFYDLSTIYVKVGVNGECVNVLRSIAIQ